MPQLDLDFDAVWEKDVGVDDDPTDTEMSEAVLWASIYNPLFIASSWHPLVNMPVPRADSPDAIPVMLPGCACQVICICFTDSNPNRFSFPAISETEKTMLYKFIFNSINVYNIPSAGQPYRTLIMSVRKGGGSAVLRPFSAFYRVIGE
jgi:hypothetical protein